MTRSVDPAWRPLLALAVPVLALIVIAVGVPGAAATSDGVDAAPAYIALGDSLAAGAGASDRAARGYVPLLRADLEALAVSSGGAAPRLINLAVPGATSTSLLADGQLEAALAELRRRNGNRDRGDDVLAITIEVGGNDLARLVPRCLAGFRGGCVPAARGALALFEANFDHALRELRTAAGDGTHIATMTLYNPLANPRCLLHVRADTAGVLLEGAPALGLAEGINDVIRRLAEAHAVAVAEVPPLLGRTATRSDCLHANDVGHRIIAGQFASLFAD